MMLDFTLIVTIISISNIPYKNYIVCYYKANFPFINNNCVINNLNDCENFHMYNYA